MFSRRSPKLSTFLSLSLAVILIDQISKWLIVKTYALHQFEPVTSFFNLGLTLNPGAAFSFLADHSGWQRWFFLALSIAASVYIFFQLKSPNYSTLAKTGFALIMGGALGNAIDRIHVGQVVDFLDFHLGGFHWPAFNIADSAILIGVALILISEFRKPKQKNIFS